MSFKKFLHNIIQIFEIEPCEECKKKESLKQLLEKLKEKRKELEKRSDEELDKKSKKELKEELKILEAHIKKGKKILKGL
jgi:glycine cleavage system protein P-like pyridoxal-binding family